MKKSGIIILLTLLLSVAGNFQKIKAQKSFCNPLDLNYRFQPRGLFAYREAADPLITIYKGKYFLFASHSGGYWYSDDMYDWKFIPIKTLPIENYAPDVLINGDTVYYTSSVKKKSYIYYSTNPLEDNWKPMDQSFPLIYSDPHFFKDNDGRLYLYSGSSDHDPIKVVELNKNLQPIGDPQPVIFQNAKEHGWELFPGANTSDRNGFIEGSWMTKYNNKYYLQYAAPATEEKTYADGVYTSNFPMGPFKYETYSPFSYKPGGFVGGAGHSATFQDKYGNYWHISTLVIIKRSRVERRLGLFPACFDNDGVLRVYTAFGDYPTIMPDKKVDLKNEGLFKGWMLLSYNKKATASSSMEEFPTKNALDEDIRTWWSAKTGNSGEWFCVQLDDKSVVNAIQVNFADHAAEIRTDTKCKLEYCYRILASNDGKNWKVVVDKTKNQRDACHEYIELEKPITSRYIKIENIKVPDGKFSISDLRIFGHKKGKKPNAVENFVVSRNANDTRKASLMWEKNPSATGYIVNYGVDRKKLYSSYMVYRDNTLEIRGLNTNVTYYFSIDAFNESGITKGTSIVTAH